MSSTEKSFLDLTTAVADRMSYPLAELNDLLTTAPGDDIRVLPQAHIGDAYRLNYVTAMVELAAHRAGVAPPTWTAAIPPLEAPVFIDPSLKLRAHPLTASPVPSRRRQYFYRLQSRGAGLMLNADRIRQLLEALNSELTRDEVRGEVFLAGGAVMCLVFRAREATKDIDALLVPANELRRAARRVAERENLPEVG